MDILFVTPSDRVGGGNRVMFELAARLSRRHRVTCAFPRSPALPKYRVHPDVRTVPVGLASGRRLSVVLNLFPLYRWLCTHIGRFDAVVSTGQITGILLPYLRHRRLYNFIQTDEYAIFKQGHLSGRPALYRIYSRLMDRSLSAPGISFIFNSAFTHRLFTEVRPARAVPRRIVHPGVDPSVFHPGPAGRTDAVPRIASMVRGHALKGLDILLEAHGSLDDASRAKASWHLITNDRLDGAALPSSFSVHRPQDDAELSGLLRQADVFLSTSLWEGFGLPALEAMACGCAVITSRNGGCGEYAIDGGNCLSYPPDDPGTLAGHLRRLLGDPGLRASLSSGGIRTARSFTWESAAARLLNILEDMA